MKRGGLAGTVAIAVAVLLSQILVACSSGCEARIHISGDDLLSTRAAVIDVIRKLGFAESTSAFGDLEAFQSPRLAYYSVQLRKKPSDFVELYFGVGGVYKCSEDAIGMFKDIRGALVRVFGQQRVIADKVTNTGQALE